MPKRSSFGLATLFAPLLVASALALVVSQYRSRVLFAELEVGQQESKSLDAEGARLRSDLGHASQPATVEALAHRLGMHAIEPQRIVPLPPQAPQALHLAGSPENAAEKAGP